MNLQEFLKKVGGCESDIVCYDSKIEALEAVKQDGYALRYVHSQTEEICKAACSQSGDALQYVDKRIFAISVNIDK